MSCNVFLHFQPFGLQTTTPTHDLIFGPVSVLVQVKKSCKRPLQNADNLERKRSLLKVFKYDPRSSLFRRRRHMYSFVPHLTSIGRLGRPHLLFLTSNFNMEFFVKLLLFLYVLYISCRWLNGLNTNSN